jgi:hypothetical protein
VADFQGRPSDSVLAPASCQTASLARSPGCSIELFQKSARFVDVLGRQSRDKHVCRHRHWIEEIFNESPS